MKTGISHLKYNIDPTNQPFYKDLLTFLGWTPMYEGEGALGLTGKGDASVWFMGEAKPVAVDYDGPGLNHLAFAAESQADVDAATAYLRDHGVPALFDTPRHRPDFGMPEDQTYYQVMFESPDHILMEVVYIGAKTA